MASDQEREHALQSLRQKLIETREWEAKLKALRLEIKGLEKDFDQTEENIKALQSVGQIIGEVLKQLDEERCTFLPCFQSHVSPSPSYNSPACTNPGAIAMMMVAVVKTWIQKLTTGENCSHRQGLLRSPIRRRMQIKSRQGEAKARHTCGARYDNTHHHAHAAA
jgi:ATP-dependent 26S proteasome regulatory subunit